MNHNQLLTATYFVVTAVSTVVAAAAVTVFLEVPKFQRQFSD